MKKKEEVIKKVDLITQLTKIIHFKKKDLKIIIDRILLAITEALVKGEKIEIRDFGTFKIKVRQPRIARNPKTGTKVEIPLRKIPYFKFSKNLVKLIRESK